MQLRLWWWRKVRYADISKTSRDLFERFGETIIASIVAGGFTPLVPEFQPIYTDEHMIEDALRWLTERGDLHEQREQRLETVEWAILIFASPLGGCGALVGGRAE